MDNYTYLIIIIKEGFHKDIFMGSSGMFFFYACRKTGRIMEWPCLSIRPSVRPSTIACERDILKTACLIDFIFLYGLNTTKTLDAIDLGHSTCT